MAWQHLQHGIAMRAHNTWHSGCDGPHLEEPVGFARDAEREVQQQCRQQERQQPVREQHVQQHACVAASPRTLSVCAHDRHQASARSLSGAVAGAGTGNRFVRHGPASCWRPGQRFPTVSGATKVEAGRLQGANLTYGDAQQQHGREHQRREVVDERLAGVHRVASAHGEAHRRHRAACAGTRDICDVLRACAVSVLLAVARASSADAQAGMPRGLHALLHLSKIIDTLTRSMRTWQRHVPVMMAWLSAVAPFSENPSRMLNSGTKKAPVM